MIPSRSSTPLLAILALTAATVATAQVPTGSASSSAAGSPATTLRERADAAFAGSDWPTAAALYRQLAELTPEDATVWFRTGLTTLQTQGDPASAIAAYQRALELGYAPAPAHFGLARAYAAAGRAAAALDELERVADLGPSRGIAQRLDTSAELAPLREDPRFRAVRERLIPCNGPHYRQFDFWLGRWRVEDPQGQVLGQNTISELTDRCILFEDWTGASGHKGVSFNYYDPRDGTWNQIFRDNTGNIAAWPNLKGTLRDGSMVLESPATATPRTRWTWTPVAADKVRQMAESSSDGGATWTVIWDSYYIRQE